MFILTSCSFLQALIWDLSSISQPVEGNLDPILAYTAGAEINQLQWSSTQPDWVAIAFSTKLQILRVWGFISQLPRTYWTGALQGRQIKSPSTSNGLTCPQASCPLALDWWSIRFKRSLAAVLLVPVVSGGIPLCSERCICPWEMAWESGHFLGLGSWLFFAPKKLKKQKASTQKLGT